MRYRVLIVTPIRSLGQLIKQVLGETGRYSAELVETSEQALRRVEGENFDLVLVDLGVEQDAVAFLDALRQTVNVPVVVMPAKTDDPQNPALQSRVDAWLSIPFYLPNLLDTLDKVAATLPQGGRQDGKPSDVLLSSAATYSQKPAPAWLQDVNLVAQHLTRLSLESSAHAALITRGERTWAYAGQLSQPAVEELAQLVGHYWEHDGGSDLARYVHLKTNGGEYMLYATSLGGDFVLALAFEAEMPFMEMRSRANALARKLSSPPPAQAAAEAEAEPPQPDVLEELPPLEGEDVPIPSDWRPDQFALNDGRQEFLEDLLRSLDIPTPEGESVSLEDTPPVDVDVSSPDWDDWEAELEDLFVEPPPEAASSFMAEDTHSAAIAHPDESPVSPDAETRPTAVAAEEEIASEEVASEEKKPLSPEPDSLTRHNLTYACVLVPRLPQHHLVGDLAEALTTWVRDLSLAFGWRLEHLSVRPDYLQWVAVVPPDQSPGMMVRNLCVETSKRIFADFPRLARDNPSGEFWAPGYLIVNGRDPFARNMVQDFIAQVRSRQGAG